MRTIRRFDVGDFYVVVIMILFLMNNIRRTIFSFDSSLVSGPTAALLKYLRSRLPSAQGIISLLTCLKILGFSDTIISNTVEVFLYCTDDNILM